MSDRVLWSCRLCTNAVVGTYKPPDRDCPACGASEDDTPPELWNMETVF